MTIALKDRMLSAALWAGAGKILSMVGSFLMTLALARALVPAAYGSYFVAFNTIMVLATVSTLGLDRVVVRFVAVRTSRHDPAGMRQVIWRCLGLVAVGALTAAVAFRVLARGPVVSILHMPALAGYLGLLAAWILSASFQRQLGETFRGLNDIRLATLLGGVRSSGILNSVLGAAAMLLLWVGGELTLFTALLVRLATSIVIVMAASTVLWRRLHGEEGGRAAGTSQWGTRAALREGWPLWFAGLVVVFNSQGVAWLASAFDTPDQVALFGVAQRFALLLIAPTIMINAVLPPIVARLHADNQLQRLQRIVRSFSGLILLPALLVLMVLVPAGGPLLRVLFGAHYEASYPILLLLCAGQVVNIATGAWQIVMPMTGSKQRMLVSSLISMLVLLVLGTVLGSVSGVVGVSLAYCASMITTNLVGAFLVRQELGIWTFASLNLRTLREARDMVEARLRRAPRPHGAAV